MSERVQAAVEILLRIRRGEVSASMSCIDEYDDVLDEAMTAAGIVREVEDPPRVFT